MDTVEYVFQFSLVQTSPVSIYCPPEDITTAPSPFLPMTQPGGASEGDIQLVPSRPKGSRG